jgi:hypothetical protein
MNNRMNSRLGIMESSLERLVEGMQRPTPSRVPHLSRSLFSSPATHYSSPPSGEYDYRGQGQPGQGQPGQHDGQFAQSVGHLLREEDRLGKRQQIFARYGFDYGS